MARPSQLDKAQSAINYLEAYAAERKELLARVQKEQKRRVTYGLPSTLLLDALEHLLKEPPSCG